MNGLFGLFPDLLEKSSLNEETLYRSRYSRKGLYDTLRSSATEYEKALAVCADDVLLYGFLDFQFHQAAPTKSAAKINTLFTGFRCDLILVLQRRSTMTKQESDRCGFKEVVTKIIHHYSDQISEGERVFNFTLLVRFQLELEELLPPWFAVKGFTGPGGPWQWVLGDMGKSIAKPPRGFESSETIPMAADMIRIMRIDQKLESLRGMILQAADLSGEELEFVRCFRRYLETGNEMEMPVLTVGTQRQRELTVTEYFNKSALKCAPGCKCSMDRMKETKAQLETFRKGNSPTAVRERTTIKDWFARMDQADAPSVPSALSPPRAQLPTKRTSVVPSPAVQLSHTQSSSLSLPQSLSQSRPSPVAAKRLTLFGVPSSQDKSSRREDNCKDSNSGPQPNQQAKAATAASSINPQAPNRDRGPSHPSHTTQRHTGTINMTHDAGSSLSGQVLTSRAWTPARQNNDVNCMTRTPITTARQRVSGQPGRGGRRTEPNKLQRFKTSCRRIWCLGWL